MKKCLPSFSLTTQLQSLKVKNHISLEFPIEAKSLNNAYNTFSNKKTGKTYRYKSKETVEYVKSIQSTLFKNSMSIYEFAGSFEKKTDAFYVEYLYKVPSDRMITQKLHISSRRPDVDNCPKLLKDTIFKFMGINDTFAIGNIGFQVPAESPSIQVGIYLMNLEDIPAYIPYIK